MTQQWNSVTLFEYPDCYRKSNRVCNEDNTRVKVKMDKCFGSSLNINMGIINMAVLFQPKACNL